MYRSVNHSFRPDMLGRQRREPVVSGDPSPFPCARVVCLALGSALAEMLGFDFSVLSMNDNITVQPT